MTPSVASITTRRLSVPLHTPFVTALRRTTTIDTLVCEITDSDGLVGWGEAPQVWQVTGDSVAGSEACLAGPLRDALLGKPADSAESAGVVASSVVANAAAKMAADVALHDLTARRAGIALAAHLGAQAGPVRTDVTLSLGSATDLAAAATARVADGFGVLKLKVGTDSVTDVARVRAVRDAVGPQVVLRLDANQGWDAFAAVRVIGEIEDAGLDVELVEQPVPADDLEALAYVTARVRTPVLADEAVFTLRDLVEVIRHRAADLVNIKLAKCGGITEALRLADLARAMGMGVLVGSMMESHIGVGAAAAVAMAIGVQRVVDLDAAWWTVRSPYLGGPAYEGDLLVLPDAPGLGIEGFAR